ncbi:MAG TPA: nucleotidyltransferase family protein [Verrucomicrobiae bacterium]|nr:nucleotidyltransferase family protein [Verrucomicrobiae bacterium]
MNVAIILAAGESRRMGQPKQLLQFGGKTMLECVIDALRSPKIDEILVVLGHRAEEIAASIRSQAGTLRPDSGQAPVPPKSSQRAGTSRRSPAPATGKPVSPRIVKNPRYQQGMFTSVQTGLRGLPKQATLVLIALCDQPRLQRATVEKLIDQFEERQHKILVPVYDGRQGHPLLFRAEYANEILGMNESLTLKHFLASHAEDVARLPITDEGVLIDIDDRATYERELRR